MLENIAIWGGIAGIIVALFAIIILFLTRQSIVNILNKDAILFDQNFEIKQKAVSSAMAVVDELAESSGTVKTSPDFSKKAKKAYNELLCVSSDLRIADEFYNITLNLNTTYNEARINLFKMICRKDIGLKVNINQRAKQLLSQQPNTQPAQQFTAQPAQYNQTQPIQEIPAQYSQVSVQPMQTNQQTIQPVQEPVVQYVQAPVQPATQAVPQQQTQPQQPVQRAAQSQARPAQRTAAPVRPAQPQQMRRVNPGNPNNNKPN